MFYLYQWSFKILSHNFYILIKGGSIDGPMNGPAPRPWDIMAAPTKEFVNSFIKIEVPHTAFVKPCHTCVGNGRVRCNDCTGHGKVTLFIDC